MPLSKLAKKFFDACIDGNLCEVNKCIENGVDVNEQDDEGLTAAMLAIEEEHGAEVLEILSQVESLELLIQEVEMPTTSNASYVLRRKLMPLMRERQVTIYRVSPKKMGFRT